MSEKYGQCPDCKGSGFFVINNKTRVQCFKCDSSGHSGSALDYMQIQADQEWDKYKNENPQWDRGW